MEYRFSSTQNNGLITQEKDWISGEEVTYAYDALNRLVSAQTTGPEWGLTWGYDGFGNRVSQTVTKGSGPSSSLSVNPANNRIDSTGYAYDPNGNLINQPGQTLTYDVKNRLTTIQGSFGSERYGYSPENQRVYRKKADATEEFYLYDGSGRVETFRMDGGGGLESITTQLYFAGRLVRTRDSVSGTEKVILTDRLGSVRVNARYDSSYVLQTERLNYFPFGEERGGATANDREKFGTYSRDSNTGLDYAMNRYYGNSMGRFLTPDPYGASASLTDPGSWNRYTYVENDPANYNDPSGLVFNVGDGLDDARDAWARAFAGPVAPSTPPVAELRPLPADDTPGGGGGGGSGMGGFLFGGGWRPEPRDPGAPRGEGGGGSPKIEPDEIVSNQKVMESLYCLWVKGGYGLRPTERAAWITKEQDEYGSVPWPWSAEAGKESWKGPAPAGSVAIAHTHPDRMSPKPSTTGGITGRGDQGTADAIDLPVYVVTRNAVWKAVPDTKSPVQVVGANWWKSFEKAKVKCPD